MKRLGGKSKADWQRICETCSSPLDEAMEACPNCGSRVIDAASILESTADAVAPETERTRKRLKKAHTIDALCAGIVFIVLLLSLVGAVILISAEGLSQSNRDVIEESLGVSLDFGYLCIGYAALASISLFAQFRISGSNNRFHSKCLRDFAPLEQRQGE